MVGVRKGAKNRRLVAVNDRGHLVGQDHPRAVLSDHEVDLMFELREGGMSIGCVARVMEVSKSCAAHILSGRRRAQVVARFVSVKRGT